MFENEFMSPSERLTAFLDGELTQEESGTLFYELAQNPELQDEMRQLVTIRNTFRNSMLVPPDHLKNKVFKRAGFSGNSNSGFYKTAAVLAGLFYSRSAVTAVAVVTLGVLSYVMISSGWGTKVADKVVAKNTVTRNIPEISSYESKDVPNLKSENNAATLPVADAVVVKKSKTHRTRIANPGSLFADDKTIPENGASELASATNMNKNIDTKDTPILDITNSLMANNGGIFFIPTKFNNNFKGGNSIDLHRFLEKVNFDFRTFIGSSTPNFELPNNNSSLLNNFSVGMNYMIDNHNTIGIAFGLENYLMSFDKYDGDILYTYKQSYNTEWFAATYQYSFDEFSSMNIRPNINILAGGTKVGPILKVGVGGTVYLNESIAIMFGYESGWLLYPNKSDWIQGEWFSTNKNGIVLGLKVGF